MNNQHFHHGVMMNVHNLALVHNMMIRTCVPEMLTIHDDMVDVQKIVAVVIVLDEVDKS